MKSKRIESIDILRGIVMIIMCLDHTRDYFQDLVAAGGPMNLETTTSSLFATRYITHFCAPIFVFLSGLSIYLQSLRKSRKELARFLLTRGLWLIFLELVLNNFLWRFDITFHVVVFQVIWAIGACMVAMAGIIYLHRYLIVALGILIVVGHNLFDVYGVKITDPESAGFIEFLWYLFHEQNAIVIEESHRVFAVGYPMLPWLGVMILGYISGQLYTKNKEEKERRKTLLLIGLGMLLLFVLLRTFNLYGDPQWYFDNSGTMFESVISFMRITKYPPSLHYVLVTIGVCFIALSLLESMRGKIANFFLVYGRVPLFFYFLHIAVIHTSSMLLKPFYGDSMYSSVVIYENYSVGKYAFLGTDLITVYLVWIIIIAVLYYPCYKYMHYKKNNPDKKWLSYL